MPISMHVTPDSYKNQRFIIRSQLESDPGDAQVRINASTRLHVRAVSTSDGRYFTINDGGTKVWHRTPRQECLNLSPGADSRPRP